VRPEVETVYGRVRGVEDAGIRVFRGLRYASAPDGPRRFLPPAPPERWTGSFDAARPGPAAPQEALPFFGWINAAGRRVGEDCLSLNLWTPGCDGGRRPVLVWIHGGGFLIGSGATPLYDGSDLARRGDLVVVTLNYRLGALGYAHLKTVFGAGFEESSNLGVRDQIAALEWIRDNVGRFGGDPGNVTLFGQSAGAMSIGALLGAPRARALFHRAILQSGAADHVLAPEEARLAARTFVQELGGPPPSHAVLARIPLEHVLRAQRRTMRRLAGLRKLMVFLPAVDGDVIPEPPLDAVRRGACARIPLLVGTTLDEWKLFRLVDEGPFRMGEQGLLARVRHALADFPQAPLPEEAARAFRTAVEERSGRRQRPGEVWSAFQTARVFYWPASRLADAQVGGGGSAHAYLFSWRPTALRRSVGACHALDIPFVFGSTQHPLARPLTGVAAATRRLSRRMQHAWIRFAHEGRPGHPKLPAWRAYDPARRATMILDRECRLAPAPLEAERALLEGWSTPPESIAAAAAGRR
jgi:para-nitrobenzyl esterase